jgi:hypothetical protein
MGKNPRDQRKAHLRIAGPRDPDATIRRRRAAASWVGVVACTACLGWLGGCSGAARPCAPCAASPAPPCVCNCAGGGTAPVAGAAGAAAAQGEDLGDLTEAASRKMMHDDGAGCLADIARIEQRDPKYARRLVVLRAQCEMLTGRCQGGKERVSTWYREQNNMSQQRADAFAEALGSMHCRGGDSTPRDELLHGLYDLNQGAYLEDRDAAYCRDRLSIVQRNAPLVKSRGPDDTQVNSLHRSLYNTAAACFARAGDCASAWTVYRDNFPAEGPGWAKTDPKTKETIIKSTFESSIARCKGKI